MSSGNLELTMMYGNKIAKVCCTYLFKGLYALTQTHTRTHTHTHLTKIQNITLLIRKISMWVPHV